MLASNFALFCSFIHYFTNEESEAQNGKITSLLSHSQKVGELVFEVSLFPGLINGTAT